MYGEYFYYAIIRKTVAMFGDMFNEITIARKTSGGNLTAQRRVPLAYAPRQDFLERLNERPDLDDDKVAITLPRMSFEISGSILYDSQRQLPPNSDCLATDSEGNVVQVYRPVPYRLPLSLYIYSKNQDEALQIIEQILPYFAPSIKRQYKWKDGEDWTDEVKFVLNSVSVEDDYQTNFQSNRKIIYTLEFDAYINIFKRVNSAAETIKTTIVNFTNSSDEKTTTIKQEVNPSSADEDDVHTIDLTYLEGFDAANP